MVLIKRESKEVFVSINDDKKQRFAVDVYDLAGSFFRELLAGLEGKKTDDYFLHKEGDESVCLFNSF